MIGGIMSEGYLKKPQGETIIFSLILELASPAFQIFIDYVCSLE